MPLGLKIFGVDWSTSLPGAPKFAADPMLINKLGVEGLFYSRSANSWGQLQPDAFNQRFFNLISGSAVPHLFLGLNEATETADPVFFDGGFRLSASASDAISAPNLTDFSYASTSFLHTFWWKPAADWAAGGNVRMLSGKYNYLDTQYVLYVEGGGTTLTAQYATGPNNGSAPNSVSFVNTFIVGTTYQVGLSWQKTGTNTSIRKLFLNGNKVAEGVLASGALTTTAAARYRIGNDSANAFPGSIIAYRSYFENLDISGNRPEDRVLFEWEKLKNKF